MSSAFLLLQVHIFVFFEPCESFESIVSAFFLTALIDELSELATTLANFELKVVHDPLNRCIAFIKNTDTYVSCNFNCFQARMDVFRSKLPYDRA